MNSTTSPSFRWRVFLLVLLMYGLCVDSFLPTILRRDHHSHPPKHRLSSTISPEPSGRRRYTSNPTDVRKNWKRQKTRSLFEDAKSKERSGRWREASDIFKEIIRNDPVDSHTHLALARLEARREQNVRRLEKQHVNQDSKARIAFEVGTENCPSSVHLWQAWALYEQQRGNYERARRLFERALELDDRNPYVAHGYGLMEKKLGNVERAKSLWELPLEARPTAAIVCSLGEQLIAEGNLHDARDLYASHFEQLTTNKDRTEVYLAAAWLEERHFNNVGRASELIGHAIEQSPGNSRALVALSRLEGRQNRRRNRPGRAAATKRLADVCNAIDNGHATAPEDGRIFNEWARIEVKSKRYDEARRILRQGIERFPRDKSLYLSAGKVEERVGNIAGARNLYATSCRIEPSAPTLLAMAMLEMKEKSPDLARVKGLFEEALMLDPRHGPLYNAYANMEVASGNLDRARRIYKQGIHAQCNDPASVYHGLGKLELSSGNVDLARDILQEGLEQVERQASFMDATRHERARFIYHTLGMLELNSGRTVEALDIFKSGVETHCNSSQLLLGCALCEVKLGSVKKARHWFERAVRVDQRHPQAWQAWGAMEFRAGRIRAATKLFEAGIKNNPRHGALWHTFAVTEGRRKNIGGARILFQAGVIKCPRYTRLYQGWAQLELRAGNLDKAKALATQALTLDKTQALGWLIAARIEHGFGDDDLAQLMLRRGIECCPTDAILYRELGEMLVAKGRIDDAREVMELGLDVNPTYAPLYHSLAELEARIFNVEALSKLNKRASEIFNSNALDSRTLKSRVLGERIRKEREPPSPSKAKVLVERVGHQVDTRETTFFDSAGQLEDRIIQDFFEDE